MIARVAVLIIIVGIAYYFGRVCVNLPAFGRLIPLSVVTVIIFPLLIWPEWGLYFVSLVSPISNPRFVLGFAMLYTHQAVIAIGTFVVVARFFSVRRRVAFSAMDVALVVFTLSILLSMLNSPDLKRSLKWLLYYSIFICSYYYLLLAVREEVQLRRIFTFLAISASVICVLAFTSGRGRIAMPAIHTFFFKNPNAFGNYLVILASFLVCLLFYGDLGGVVRKLLAAALLLMGVAVVLTFSRSSWLGLLTGLLGINLVRPNPKAIAVVAVLIAAVFLFGPVQERIVEDIGDAGIQYRITKVKAAYALFQEHPFFGNGPGSFEHYAALSDEWALSAHSSIENLYMQLLSEGGLVQVAAFLFLVLTFIRQALLAVRKIQTPFLKAVVTGAIASFLAMLGIGFGENIFLFPKINWLLAFFMAAVPVALQLEAEKGEEA